MSEPLAILPNRSNESSVTARTGLLHCHGPHRDLGLVHPLSDEDEFFTERNPFGRLQYCVFLPPPPPQRAVPPI